MNILHLTTYLQGGAGRIITALALNQKENGHNVSVLASKTPAPGYCNYDEYLVSLKTNNIPFNEVDSSFKRDLGLNLLFAAAVRKVIVNRQIDIIHAHAAVPALVGIIGRSGTDRYIPVIQTMHGWGINKSAQHEQMDITIMNGLDKVVTVSKSDQLLLAEKGVNQAKLKVIYNGILELENGDVIDQGLVKELQERKRAGYFIIGCIGTVSERKNQQLLLDAVKVLAGKHKIYCAFIGEGELISKLQKEVEDDNLGQNIKFYGYVSNASNYLKYMDLFVLPSRSEGFGLAIVESFREKTPVVASKIDVFRELITDQENGFLFEDNDVNSLLDVIENVIDISEDKKVDIINNAFSTYTSFFTFKKMAIRYLDLYCNLLKYGAIG
jgi:glycosyltransferase involved in cell wall biosynthesis